MENLLQIVKNVNKGIMYSMENVLSHAHRFKATITLLVIKHVENVNNLVKPVLRLLLIVKAVLKVQYFTTVSAFLHVHKEHLQPHLIIKQYVKIVFYHAQNALVKRHVLYVINHMC